MNETDRRYVEQFQAEVASHRVAAEQIGGEIASLQQRYREHMDTVEAAEQLLAHVKTKGRSA
jgi:septation ring formation regulator EzrA